MQKDWSSWQPLKSRVHSYFLTFGHLATDICQGSLPALLPFLMASYSLSYTQAASLVFASGIVSAVVQPLFGIINDRVNKPWFMSLGIIISGLGISLIGFVHEFHLLMVCAVISGIGTALFHPEGGKLANIMASGGKAAGISIFSVGGYAGFAIGPIIVAGAMTFIGMPGTVVFMVPTIIMAVVILTQSRRYQHFAEDEMAARRASPEGLGHDDVPGFSKVTALNLARATMATGITTFLPLFLIAQFAIGNEVAALTLSVYSAVGAVATFFGGFIADRIGFKRLVLLSFCVTLPLLAGFVFAHNYILAIALIMLVALFLSSANSPLIVLGQGYLPNHLGLSTGISLGVVISVGSMTSPLIGLAGDHWGLTSSMLIICAVAVLAVFAALFVYRHRDKNISGEKGGGPADRAAAEQTAVDAPGEAAARLAAEATAEATAGLAAGAAGGAAAGPSGQPAEPSSLSAIGTGALSPRPRPAYPASEGQGKRRQR